MPDLFRHFDYIKVDSSTQRWGTSGLPSENAGKDNQNIKSSTTFYNLEKYRRRLTDRIGLAGLRNEF